MMTVRELILKHTTEVEYVGQREDGIKEYRLITDNDVKYKIGKHVINALRPELLTSTEESIENDEVAEVQYEEMDLLKVL